MKIKLLIASLVLILIPFFSFAATIPVTNPGGIYNATVDASIIISRIADFIIGAIALLGIVFLVWGGILYVTSAGDDAQIEKAKTTMTYAILGLFVAGLAFAIETLIFTTFVG
jgi:hypothetical protein